MIAKTLPLLFLAAAPALAFDGAQADPVSGPLANALREYRETLDRVPSTHQELENALSRMGFERSLETNAWSVTQDRSRFNATVQAIRYGPGLADWRVRVFTHHGGFSAFTEEYLTPTGEIVGGLPPMTPREVFALLSKAGVPAAYERLSEAMPAIEVWVRAVERTFVREDAAQPALEKELERRGFIHHSPSMVLALPRARVTVLPAWQGTERHLIVRIQHAHDRSASSESRFGSIQSLYDKTRNLRDLDALIADLSR